MNWLDRVLHLLGIVATGVTTTLAATETHAPKGVIIAAGVTSYVAAAAAKSLIPPKTEK